MSDQALAWKAAFGALVLVFCAVTYVTRTTHENKAQLEKGQPKLVPAPPELLAAPLAPASQPAPLDVEEDAPPVRVSVALHDAHPAAPAKAALRTHARSSKVHPAKLPAPRVYPVAAKRKPSPYKIGRQHYPYDPKERWALRDAP
jgi:hypothetical protein